MSAQILVHSVAPLFAGIMTTHGTVTQRAARCPDRTGGPQLPIDMASSMWSDHPGSCQPESEGDMPDYDRLSKAAEETERNATDAARAVASLWRSQLEVAIAADDEKAVSQIVKRGAAEAGIYGDTNCVC
jgi:hypothetical protein